MGETLTEKKINEKINVLREKLNNLMENEGDYIEIYKVSTALDELIFEYLKIS